MLFSEYKYKNLFALLAPLIFAVHPIHTELVTWISERIADNKGKYFFELTLNVKSDINNTRANDVKYKNLSAITLYQYQGKKEQKRSMLEKLQIIYPNYKNTASLLSGLNSTDSTGNNLESESQQKNDNIYLLEVKAYKLFKGKKYEYAINALQDLVNVTDDTSITKKSDLLNNIAMCYLEMNKPDLEKKYFLEAINMNSKNLNALNGIAAYYKKTNDSVKYKYYLTQILKINPKDTATRRTLDSLNSK
ncbi:MAG: hypothetical protein M3R36_05675 [Bacteroidota bacterium]|nr:hypothetical protein [Bacteroidota bacterium]